jgi:hypothetical protein
VASDFKEGPGGVNKVGLTQRQKEILELMKEHGHATFGTCGRGQLIATPTDIGVSIRVYSYLHFFLEVRGLIEKVPGVRPVQYRLVKPIANEIEEN